MSLSTLSTEPRSPRPGHCRTGPSGPTNSTRSCGLTKASSGTRIGFACQPIERCRYHPIDPRCASDHNPPHGRRPEIRQPSHSPATVCPRADPRPSPGRCPIRAWRHDLAMAGYRSQRSLSAGEHPAAVPAGGGSLASRPELVAGGGGSGGRIDGVPSHGPARQLGVGPDLHHAESSKVALTATSRGRVATRQYPSPTTRVFGEDTSSFPLPHRPAPRCERHQDDRDEGGARVRRTMLILGLVALLALPASAAGPVTRTGAEYSGLRNPGGCRCSPRTALSCT